MTKQKSAASMIRLVDIAKQLGVSNATVSRALRGLSVVPEKTRNRVIACANQMGYRPNPALSALAAYRKRIRSPSGYSQLAFVTNFSKPEEWRGSFVEGLFEGAQRQAKSFGYELVHYWLRQDHRSQQEASSILYHRGIKGLIIAPSRRSASHLNLTWKEFACVALGVSLAKPRLHYVAFDHHGATQSVFHILKDRGYTRIGLVWPYPVSAFMKHMTLDAFLGEQFRLRKSAVIPPLLLTSKKLMTTSFLKWVEEHRPDAIIALSDWIDEIMELGLLQVPQEIGFACPSFQSNRFKHDLSGIIEDWQALGVAAVNQLHGQLLRGEFGVPDQPTGLMIQGKWHEGATAGKAGSIHGTLRKNESIKLI